MYFTVESMGNRMFIRDEDGDISSSDFKPTLFQPTTEDTDWSNIQGDKMSPVQFDSMGSARDFIKSRKKLSNNGLHGNQNFYVQYISQRYSKEKYNFDKIRILFIDIEVVPIEVDENGNEYQGGFPDPNESKYPITSIAIYDTKSGWIQWGCKRGFTPKPDAVYRSFTDESAMMNDFLHHWNMNCPHMVVGWNSDSFDIPYIVNRITKILGYRAVQLLSPFGKVSERTAVNEFGQDETVYHIFGVQSIDYMKLYKKFTYTMRENYRLDTIAEIECGINKLDFGEAKNFLELLRGNYDVSPEKRPDAMADADRYVRLRTLMKQSKHFNAKNK